MLLNKIKKKISYPIDGWLIAILLYFYLLPLSRAYLSLFGVFLPIAWLISRKKDCWHELKKPTQKLLIALGLFACWQIVSLHWSETIDLSYIANYLYWLCIPIILYIVKAEHITTLVSAFLLGMFTSELISYGIFFHLFDFKNIPASNPSPFMIHIEYSVFLATIASLLMYRALSQGYDYRDRIFFIFFFITSTSNLFIVGGRTGQASFLISIILLFILRFKLTIKTIFLALLATVLITTAAYHSSKLFNSRANLTISSINRIIDSNDYFSSIGQRIAAWPVSYAIWKDNPFVGVGTGDVQAEFRKKVLSDFPQFHRGQYTVLNNSHLHNQYLMALVQTGAIGLILLFYIIYCLYKLPISNPSYNHFKIIFMFIYFISCLAEPLWVKQFSMNLFVAFISIFLIISEKPDKKISL